MKAAVLVLLHKYSDQQKTLLAHLSKKFDVFVHIDKRTTIKPNELSRDNIRVFKEYDIYWGSHNQILATIHLLRKAGAGNYDRYMIISGEDVPIKNNAYIEKFFLSNNKEYLDSSRLPVAVWKDNGGFDRIDYYYPNSLSRGSSARMAKLSNKSISIFNNRIAIPLMKSLQFKRRLDISYWGGINWMDLTNSCVQQMLTYIDNNHQYVKRFKYTKCADEIFFHTIIFNYCSGLEFENLCLRFVDWSTGPEYPRILRINDYDRLIKSNRLFGRKFDKDVDSNIINKIYRELEK